MKHFAQDRVILNSSLSLISCYAMLVTVLSILELEKHSDPL